MSNSRYNRWQGLALTQFSVSIALVSGLSVSGIGVALSQRNHVAVLESHIPIRLMLLFAVIAFLCAILLSLSATISRTLDFRLTARKVRSESDKNYSKPLIILGCNSDDFGKITWRFFWGSLIFFAIATLVSALYLGLLFEI